VRPEQRRLRYPRAFASVPPFDDAPCAHLQQGMHHSDGQVAPS
jgi:hypothetical protein